MREIARSGRAGDSLGNVLTYTYTTTGSLLREVDWSGPLGSGANHSVQWAYDNDHRVLTEAAAGLTAQYAYDGDGLLHTVTVENGSGPLTNGTLSLTRDLDGNKNGLVWAAAVGGQSDSRTPNAYGELAVYAAGAEAGYTLDSTAKPRDGAGRITERVETAPTSRTLDYQYDARGRLTTVLNGAATVEHYGYDANGNRNGWTNNNSLVGASNTGTWTCSVADAQDRLTSCSKAGGGTIAYTYTPNGDVATRTVPGLSRQTLTYDAFGSLLSVVPDSGSRIDYVIDGQGHRIGKKVGGTTTRQWLWGNQLRPIAELDGSGTVLARYIYATHVNVPDLIVKGTTVYRVLTDHLGSVLAIVDVASGVTVRKRDYDSFGNMILDAADPGTPNQDGFQTFGFAGGMYDADTELTRFGARDLDPISGRWLAKDPLQFSGGDSNLYAYAGNNPINYTDPYGTDYGFGRALWDYTVAFGEGVLTGVVIVGLVGTGPVGIAAGGALALVGVNITAENIGALVTGHDYDGNELSEDEWGQLAASTTGSLVSIGVSSVGYVKGPEFETDQFPGVTKGNLRVAPWGNRTSNPDGGELPHCHYGKPNPRQPGGSRYGQGSGNHRPWQGGV